jgi:uncharacterized protein with HEPN domain
MTLRRVDDYLGHIVAAIERIDRYLSSLDEDGFQRSEIAQDAVIRNIEIIGEACNNILKRFPEFAEAHPELSLAVAHQMRNAVAHGYFDVDLATVWRTAQDDLPRLLQQVQAALEQTGGSATP